MSKHQISQYDKECINIICTLLGKNNTNVWDQLISAHHATATSNLKALQGISNALQMHAHVEDCKKKMTINQEHAQILYIWASNLGLQQI